MIFGSNKSFFAEERKKLETQIKTPLLELVLEHLPHLQLTTELQDDLWEAIAIKLNDLLFKKAIKVDGVEELPTLNGPYVKDMFDDIMDMFIRSVAEFNKRNGIYRSNIEVNNNHVIYLAYKFPVREAYTERDDVICCELFYLKGLEIETKAKLAKERYLSNVRAHLEGKPKPTELEDTKLNSLNERVESLLKELEKRNSKIQNLDKENKRLMELNSSLLDR